MECLCPNYDCQTGRDRHQANHKDPDISDDQLEALQKDLVAYLTFMVFFRTWIHLTAESMSITKGNLKCSYNSIKMLFLRKVIFYFPSPDRPSPKDLPLFIDTKLANLNGRVEAPHQSLSPSSYPWDILTQEQIDEREEMFSYIES